MSFGASSAWPLQGNQRRDDTGREDISTSRQCQKLSCRYLVAVSVCRYQRGDHKMNDNKAREFLWDVVVIRITTIQSYSQINPEDIQGTQLRE